MSNRRKAIANLSPEQKRKLLSQLLQKQANQSQRFPLSFAQTRLWFLDQLESKSSVYNIPAALRLSGVINIAALEKSLNEIIRRHEILRTHFTIVKGEPYQQVISHLTLDLPRVDLQDLSSEQQEVEVRKRATQEALQPFDLERGTLLRSKLLKLGESEYVLLFTVHHIISDYWSMRVLIRELAAIYQTFLTGNPSPLPELPIQYADYAVWQRKWLQGEARSTQLDYWKQQLGNNPPVLQLPTDYPRPATQTFRGATQSFSLSHELSEALRSLSRQEGVTLFMTLLAALKTLLYRYTAQEDILVGSIVANRDRPEIEDLIGLVVNNLVFRTDLSGNPNFRELLRQVREVTLGAYAHQDLPFEYLVEELQPERNLSYNPLFQVMFILHNTPTESLQLPSLTLSYLKPDSQTARFDLSLDMYETPSGLTGVFEYNTDLFKADTINRLIGHFQTLLAAIVANPEQRLSDLPLLTPVEQQLLVAWNETQTAFERQACIHQLFEAQVERTPDAIAVVFEGKQLTYRELNTRANQLAHYLQKLGINPEQLIGICVERSLKMVVGLLGILKASGAYVPLDPAYPQERIDFIIEDSQVSVLLTGVGSRESGVGNVICLDRDWGIIAQESEENLSSNVTPDNSAYVIYTSGSTGQPKGVQVLHSSLVNFLTSMRQTPGLTQVDTLLSVTTLSFDIAGLELYLPLMVGARLVIVNREVAADGSQLLERLNSYGTTIMQATPATWRLLLAAGWQGDRELKILCGGEALDAHLAQHLLERGQEVWNLYGPTETTIWSAIHRVEEEISGSVSIGFPLANTQFYVLDAQLNSLPIGIPGELYIGGAGLARGYLNRPDLTAEKFIPNPFIGREQGNTKSEVRSQKSEVRNREQVNNFQPSTADPAGTEFQQERGSAFRTFNLQLYKTGDLVRYQPDGTLEYLGRIDHQVKLRGFRIELGEIEAVLSQHPDVSESVVSVREDEAGDKRLVAYIVPNQPDLNTSNRFPIQNQIRRFLEKKLPSYMVPSVFVLLESFPLTPNGKIDRRSLPNPNPPQLLTELTFVAPRTSTEEMLVGIWANVLNLEQVGIHDNFFALGGHSLLATRAISQIRQVFEIDLPLRRLFENPTVAELGKQIETAKLAAIGLAISPIERISREGELPLSFAQQRQWFLAQLEPDSSFYNIPAAIRLKGQLNLIILQQSFNEVLHRHEVLRTAFKTIEGKPKQAITPTARLSLPIIDLSTIPASERDAEVKKLAKFEVQQPFDLNQSPLLRVKLLRLNEQEHVVLLTMHHIVSDAWSIRVLVHELVSLYQAFDNKQPSPLEQLPIQYIDFAAWQRQWLESGVGSQATAVLGFQRQLHNGGNPNASCSWGKPPRPHSLRNALSPQVEQVARESGVGGRRSNLEVQLAYWREQLKNAPPILELPSDRPRPAIQTFRGATCTFRLSQTQSKSLKTLSQDSGSTLFISLLAAFKTLLYRYTGSEDIVVGSPIANRNRSEIEGLIGFFANTLTLRTDLSGNPPFATLLQRVKEVALGAYAHQDLPFEQLVEELQPQRDLSYTPLFQVMFVLQNAPMQPIELLDLSWSPIESESGTAKFDLTLYVAETDEGLVGTFEYNTDLFESATIERMTGHFQTLLSGIVANPQQRLSHLPLLSELEKQQLLGQWNDPQAQYPENVCLHELFEAQVEQTPDAIAVVFETETLTYRELNRRANQLAHYLQKLGVKPEVPVGICVERSLNMVVGVLGILKAGGAYVPLDPTYPKERLDFMLNDSQVSVLLTGVGSWELGVGSRESGVGNVFCLDKDWKIIRQESQENPNSSVTPGNLAYIIYTSGSTGQPKGVAIAHSSPVTLMHWAREVFTQEQLAGVLASTSICFDLSVFELFVPLSWGGKVILAENALGLPNLPAVGEVSLVNTVPSAATELLRVKGIPDSVQTINLAGEALPNTLVQQLYQQRNIQQVFNLYGPSEDTTYSTFALALKGASQAPPIGRPIANTQAYILDRYFQPVPIGVVGELYLGGKGLARGYLNRSDLTAEKFIPNPFRRRQEAGGRVRNRESGVGSRELGVRRTEFNLQLYKTGDLARYLPDGNIEYLGRLDNQVKVRGFRIELGEIEALLSQHPEVSQAVVNIWEDNFGNKRLVAYIVPSLQNQIPPAHGTSSSTGTAKTGVPPLTKGGARRGFAINIMGEPKIQDPLRRFLKEKLPEYMVPAIFVTLEAIPLTPNGKLDRKALPAPDNTKVEGDDPFVAPRTSEEKELVQIWSQLLGVEQIGIHDHFFELGGDSILAIQVIARANQVGLQLTPKLFFQYQTIAELAAVVETKLIRIEQGIVTGFIPLTPIQHWFFEQNLADPHHWNQAILLEVRQALNPLLLGQAVQKLLEHHDALRLKFAPTPSGWQQTNASPTLAVPFTYLDLSELFDTRQDLAMSIAATQLQASFDLASEPLMRVALFALGENRSSRLLLVLHHLVIDGISWRILLEDLQTTYQQLSQGEVIQLPLKTTSFKQWAEQLREFAHSTLLQQELEYWTAQSRLSIEPLPVDFPGGNNTMAEAQTISVALSTEETQALLSEVPATYQTQINDVLLTALLQAFEQWTGKRQLLIELEGHGREDMFDDLNLSRTVGWFTTLFPVLLNLGDAKSSGDAIKSIKEQLSSLPNQGFNYGVLRYLGSKSVKGQLQALPQAEIRFNYLGQSDPLFSQSSLFVPAYESSGIARSPRDQRSTLLEINGIVTRGQLRLGWTYSKGIYRQSTVENLAQHFIKALCELIRHCLSPEAGGYTPSDFPQMDFNQDELDELLGEYL